MPVFITAAPVEFAVATVLPDGLILPFAGASTVVFFSLSYFFGQVGADFGKRVEPALWKSWGGPPATRFLRHDNKEFNSATRTRIHAKLRNLGLEVPTAEEERADDDRARQLYDSAVDELRSLTRDPHRFHLVYKSNIEYGFRRNMLGLKPIGITVTIAALLITGWTLLCGWHTERVIPHVAPVTTLLNCCVAIGWLVGVRAATVRITADRYARSLLDAAMTLEPSK
jgi:hypothetical protein